MSVYPPNQRISNKTNRCNYCPGHRSKSQTETGRGGAAISNSLPAVRESESRASSRFGGVADSQFKEALAPATTAASG